MFQDYLSVGLKGNVSILNAPGTGIADDKAVYAYVEKKLFHIT